MIQEQEAVAALAAAMSNDRGRLDSSYPTAYGYLKATVQQYLDGRLTRAQLEEGLTCVETALFAYRAELQRRRDSHPVIR